MALTITSVLSASHLQELLSAPESKEVGGPSGVPPQCPKTLAEAAGEVILVNEC